MESNVESFSERLARSKQIKEQRPKTYMRKSLITRNPSVVKSGTDGGVYKQTGKTVEIPVAIPKGKVYAVPPATSSAGFNILLPFGGVMSKKLKEKGLTPPTRIADRAKLFYNQVVAAKGFDGAKPVNFEAIDNADAETDEQIIGSLLTYFKSLVAGVQPNGTPLATQDAAIAPEVKNVVQTMAEKVAAAGLSPEDAAAAGAQFSNTAPPEPFYKKPWVKWTGIAIVVIVVIVVFFK